MFKKSHNEESLPVIHGDESGLSGIALTLIILAVSVAVAVVVMGALAQNTQTGAADVGDAMQGSLTDQANIVNNS